MSSSRASFGKGARVGGEERLAHHLEVGEKRVRARVAARLKALGARQSLAGQGDHPAQRLARVLALGQRGGFGDDDGGALERTIERGGVGQPLLGRRQRVGQPHQVTVVAGEDGVAKQGQRALGDRLVDEGVAVAVRAHPGAEAPGQREGVGIERAERILERGVQAALRAWDDVEQDVLEIVEAGLDLVEHLGLLAALHGVLPQRFHGRPQHAVFVVLLALGGPEAVARLEAGARFGEEPLGGAPSCFGRVGGEDVAELDLTQRGQHFVARGAAFAQLGQDGRQRLGHARRPAFALAPGQLAGPLDVLGEVDELEVEGERTRDLGRRLGVERAGARRERLARFLAVLFPRPLGRQAHRLHVLEEGLSTVRTEHLAQGVSDQPHVVCESFAPS